MSYFKEENRGNESCVCNKKHVISLSTRHTSWLVSCFIVLSFFVFISGYFMGKKKGVQEFSRAAVQESLADQVYCSVCTLYDKQEKSAKENNLCTYLASESENKDTTVVAKNFQKSGQIEVANELNDNAVYSLAQVGVDSQLVKGLSNNAPAEAADSEKYYAQLVGFGTQKAADRFIARMHKQDISVKLKKRRSKTAKGKQINWYQVITDTYNNKNQVTALVDRIKKVERLHDVRIVTS